jgi:hypothetical protein
MRKQWWCMIITVLAIACFTGSVFAQVPAKEPIPVKEETQRTVKGKIVYSATMKRYVIRGRGEMYGIANQNPDVLDQLAKGKQTVTIVGHITVGDSLFIEKIDDTPYQGVKGPGSK